MFLKHKCIFFITHLLVNSSKQKLLLLLFLFQLTERTRILKKDYSEVFRFHIKLGRGVTERVPNFGAGRQKVVLSWIIHVHSNSRCSGFLIWPFKLVIWYQLCFPPPFRFKSVCHSAILKSFLGILLYKYHGAVCQLSKSKSYIHVTADVEY